MKPYHVPVMLSEVIELLQIEKDKWYIDGTLGGGGHTEAILDAGGRVLAIDQDNDSLEFVTNKFKVQNSKFKIGEDIILEQDNFRNIKGIVEKHNLKGKIAGILLDLGVSSFQIDRSGRGFSLRRNEPLDMRMSDTGKLTAAEIVNTWPYDELVDVIERYGEEEQARVIAGAIVERRKEARIETSKELGLLIEKAVERRGDIHPATRAFMALRIVVNDELAVIREAIVAGSNLLEAHGRMAIISFHSLEDRIVKTEFQKLESRRNFKIVTKRPIVASDTEVERNRRARSAKLRVMERV